MIKGFLKKKNSEHFRVIKYSDYSFLFFSLSIISSYFNKDELFSRCFLKDAEQTSLFLLLKKTIVRL